MIALILLIFISGLILAVLKIVKQIIDERKCASDFEIIQFYNQQLKKNDAAYRRFIAHLGICEKCQNRLHNVDEIEDQTEKDISDHLLNDNK